MAQRDGTVKRHGIHLTASNAIRLFTAYPPRGWHLRSFCPDSVLYPAVTVVHFDADRYCMLVREALPRGKSGRTLCAFVVKLRLKPPWRLKRRFISMFCGLNSQKQPALYVEIAGRSDFHICRCSSSGHEKYFEGEWYMIRTSPSLYRRRCICTRVASSCSRGSSQLPSRFIAIENSLVSPRHNMLRPCLDLG